MNKKLLIRIVNAATSIYGRIFRVLLGMWLIYVAFGTLQDPWQWMVGDLGLLLIISGLLGACVLNKLIGRPIIPRR
ncbi:MAG: YgaP-like transmembrane domain [Candidatus Saccharimonas aalborgensis]